MSFDLPALLAAKAVRCHQPGRWPEARELYRKIVILQPENPEALSNFATACQFLGDKKRAAAGFIRSLALKPDQWQAAYNFATLFQQAGHLNIAIDAFHGAIAAKPDEANAYNNLARCLEELGIADKAHQRALRLNPRDDNGLMNQVLAQLYQPGVDPARMLADARIWAATQPKAAAPRAMREQPRIGMVSADFRRHAVGRLVLPTVEKLGGVTLYMNSAKFDDLTTRFQQAAGRWRQADAMTDAQLAQQIRDDGIDILFDLSGFTHGNRLSMFALRPAPVQIAWAGYPGTTGLAAIDYLLGDRHQMPEGVDAFYSEKLIRLPHSYVCFVPPPESPPLTSLPALRNGHVTFGCFNAAKKLNKDVLALWGRILQAIPSARLSCQTEAFSLPDAASRFIGIFAGMGIAADRLSFAGSTPLAAHQAAMAATDIALDPFPYSGGQTTLESLWAGLPVVTLPGRTMASRHSCGYLQSAGLPELIAKDQEDYFRIAVGLADDLPRLAALRAGMRQRLLDSPLCDVDGFVRDFTAALARIWASHQGADMGRN